jgi:flagellar biogenesis protein FliO
MKISPPLSPSPGTPGEGWGEGSQPVRQSRSPSLAIHIKPLLTAILLTTLTAAPLLADATPLPSDTGKPILRDPLPASPALPAAPSGSSSVTDFDSGRVALALIGVIALIVLLRYAAKQMFPSVVSAGRNRTVTVLARCALAPRQQVVLIKIGRRIVVAADCASQLTSLCQITDPDEVAALLGQIQSDKTAPVGSPFNSWFNRAAEAFGPEQPAPATDNLPDDLPQSPADSPDIGKLTERVRGLARQWATSEKKAQA